MQLSCPAGSEPALRGFYVDVLGLAEIAKPPVLARRGGAWFRGSGRDGAPVELHLGVEADFRPARKAHPGLLLEDGDRPPSGPGALGGLDAVATRLAAAGCPVRWDGDLPGMRRFYSEDAVGNRLEFLAPAPA